MRTITQEMIDGTRLLVSQEYASLPDEDIRGMLESRLHDMEADIAGILQGISGAVGALTPAIGGMVGGRAGRAISTAGRAIGTIGNLGAHFARAYTGTGTAQPAQPAVRVARAPQQPVRLPAGQAPRPVTNTAPGTSRTSGIVNAAGQLARMVYTNPQIMQALGSALMGPNGRRTIPAGNAGPNVPVGSYLNMIGQLANSASIENEAIFPDEEQSADWLCSEDGALAVENSENSTERADALIELINIAGSQNQESGEGDDSGQIEPIELDEMDSGEKFEEDDLGSDEAAAVDLYAEDTDADDARGGYEFEEDTDASEIDGSYGEADFEDDSLEVYDSDDSDMEDYEEDDLIVYDEDDVDDIEDFDIDDDEDYDDDEEEDDLIVYDEEIFDDIEDFDIDDDEDYEDDDDDEDDLIVYEEEGFDDIEDFDIDDDEAFDDDEEDLMV